MFVEKAPKGAFCVFTLFQKIDWDGLKRGGGALLEQDMLKVYYGAADECIALATMPLNALWRHLGLPV
jgi:hypothetical protein